MELLTVTVDPSGRVVIPPAQLAALNLQPGQPVSLLVGDAGGAGKFREVPPYDEDKAWTKMVMSTLTEWADPEDQLMTTCDLFETVMVPFPYTDLPLTRLRPALILSGADFTQQTGHAFMAMITSGRRSIWPGDMAVEDLDFAGLNIPSIVRMKFFTLSTKLIQRSLGRLCQQDIVKVRLAIKSHLSLTLAA